MPKLLIFAGTTEGRERIDMALQDGDTVIACVASVYARTLLPENIHCHTEPMTLPDMIETARKHAPDRIIDATHPFATLVSQNIRQCAAQLNIGCERIERPTGAHAWRDHVIWADDAEQAASIVAKEQGTILLTTGSRTLHTYADAIDPSRLYARVLPMHEALSVCAQSGILPSHIIAMQGPFSIELNAALYRQFDIKHVVSKDSGAAGGVDEKVIPALQMGINVVMIKRPKEA